MPAGETHSSHSGNANKIITNSFIWSLLQTTHPDVVTASSLFSCSKYKVGLPCNQFHWLSSLRVVLEVRTLRKFRTKWVSIVVRNIANPERKGI